MITERLPDLERQAQKFGENGYKVIITGRRKEKLDDLEKELSSMGAEVLSLNFDVRKRYETEDIIGSLPEEWKNIDVLVNNAGLAVGMDHIDKGNIDDWERMIDTNIKGLLYVTRAVAPLMVSRNRGHIINISSIAGKEVYENGNVYCATKHAVTALSKAMRIDMLKSNIKVTNIALGFAETEFSLVRFKETRKGQRMFTRAWSRKAEDVADVIFFCANLPEHVCINELEITPTIQVL